MAIEKRGDTPLNLDSLAEHLILYNTSYLSLQFSQLMLHDSLYHGFENTNYNLNYRVNVISPTLMEEGAAPYYREYDLQGYLKGHVLHYLTMQKNGHVDDI